MKTDAQKLAYSERRRARRARRRAEAEPVDSREINSSYCKPYWRSFSPLERKEYALHHLGMYEFECKNALLDIMFEGIPAHIATKELNRHYRIFKACTLTMQELNEDTTQLNEHFLKVCNQFARRELF